MSSDRSEASHEQRVQDALQGLLSDEAVELEAVDVLAEAELVLVRVRLPDVATVERLRLEERVFTDLRAMQEGMDGASGHVYAPVFS